MMDDYRAAELIGMFGDAIQRDGIRNALGCFSDGIITAYVREEEEPYIATIAQYLLSEVIEKIEQLERHQQEWSLIVESRRKAALARAAQRKAEADQ